MNIPRGQRPSGIYTPRVVINMLFNEKECVIVVLLYTVYATTAGSPYIYRNCTVCTVGMGGNDMRRPRPRTESMSSLCILY